MILLLIQIHSETNNFLSTKVIWERKRRGFIGYLSAWGSDRRVKNGNESWDVLRDSRKCYRGQWAEIGKYWPSKEPIRLQDSLPCPLKKKKKKKKVFDSKKTWETYCGQIKMLTATLIKFWGSHKKIRGNPLMMNYNFFITRKLAKKNFGFLFVVFRLLILSLLLKGSRRV